MSEQKPVVRKLAYLNLNDPKLVKWYWIVGLIVLGIIMALDLTVHHHAHFAKDGIDIDTTPEFYPLYGFAASFFLVIIAKTLSIALKRKDSYYADD